MVWPHILACCTITSQFPPEMGMCPKIVCLLSFRHWSHRLQQCSCDPYLINFIWFHCAARFLHFLNTLTIIFILYMINLPEAILMEGMFIWTNDITITKDDKRKGEWERQNEATTDCIYFLLCVIAELNAYPSKCLIQIS